MKFEEMGYIRPDDKNIITQYNLIIDKFDDCKKFEEQLDIIQEHEKIYSSFLTMCTLTQIRHTIDTTDKFYDEENKYLNSISPVIQDRVQLLYDKIINSKFINDIKKELGEIFISNLEIERKVFSPEIIPLLQKENQLKIEYQSLIASAKIEFDGKILNTSQMTPYKNSSDREIRKNAYNAEGNFYLSIKDKLDSIYENLVKLRDNISKKLGFNNFIDVAYFRLGRDCYNKKDVEKYRDQVSKYIVPFLIELKENQSKRINVDKIKFYDDTFMFLDGNPTPHGTDIDIMDAGKNMYSKMSDITNEFIDYMFSNNLFDLVSKPGKAVGGYCTFINDYKSPFIFSNFNGTSGDVDVFTHEAGHALHAYISRDSNLIETQSPNLETCEVHSMSMEYLAWPWLELFYKSNTNKAKFAQLEHSVNFLPYGCMVDEFQHNIYENPNMSPKQRDELWLSLENKYRPYMDFEDIPFYKDGSGWQRQLHIYMHPFYYIDYCLAETVALQFSDLSSRDYDLAFSKYIKLLNIGGSSNFIDTLKMCDIKIPFEDGTVAYILEHIKNSLKNL